MRQIWESQATVRGQHSSPTVPPNAATSQPVVFTDPFPQQGFVATQPPHAPVTTQPSPSGSSNYQILMMTSDQPLTVDLNLQTRSRQYSMPPAPFILESSYSGPRDPMVPCKSLHPKLRFIPRFLRAHYVEMLPPVGLTIHIA